MCSTSCPRAIAGWLAGCAAATGVICAFAFVISALAAGGIFSVRSAGILLLPATLIFLVTCVLTGIPAAVVDWLREKVQLQSICFFGTVGAAIGGLSQTLLFTAFTSRPAGVNPLFLLAGLAAGLVYWLVAGHRSEGDRS